ncbi:MAG TPA: hypothetical protein VMU34_07395 [Mycobacterium sp.]|nr:hypothetical protein [Mycobacterium sp.]
MPAYPSPGAPAAASSAAGPLRLPDGRTVYLVGTDPLLTRIGAEMGDAVDAVVGFWGDDWNRQIVIVATDTAAQFAVETRVGQGQFTDIAAATVADGFDPATRAVTGERIVFAPGAGAMSEPSLGIVVRHELFHYAARADTAADAPRWLTEGVADYVGRPQTPPTADPAIAARLPSDSDFAGPGVSVAYDRAWLFARFVADHYGRPALRRLYLLACGPGHPDAATAVSDVLGASVPDVLAQWRQWLG